MSWTDFIDIVLAALLLWIGLHSIRNTRARAAGLGLLCLGAVFIVAKQAKLQLTLWLLQGLAAVFLIIVVVVFQAEIRQLIERLPNIWRQFRFSKPALPEVIEILLETLATLVRTRTGALIVLKGSEPIEGLATGGIPLEGRLSKPLLLSIFDSSSPGHDGAVILRGDVIERFGAHLPLSHDEEQLKERGTRHAAALGLAEECDAMVVVVSEERGKVSIAHQGKLTALARSRSAEPILTAFVTEHSVSVGSVSWFRKLIQHYGGEGLIAGAVAIILWLVVIIPGSMRIEQMVKVPVAIQNIPSGFSLSEFSPIEVSVTIAGAQRDLTAFDPVSHTIQIDATLTQFGRENFSIFPNHFLLPPGIDLIRFTPSQVKVVVGRVPPVQ